MFHYANQLNIYDYRKFITAGSRPPSLTVLASVGESQQWWKVSTTGLSYRPVVIRILEIPKLGQRNSKKVWPHHPQPSHKSRDFLHENMHVAWCSDLNLRPVPSRVAALTTPPLSHLCLYSIFIPLVLTF